MSPPGLRTVNTLKKCSTKKQNKTNKTNTQKNRCLHTPVQLAAVKLLIEIRGRKKTKKRNYLDVCTEVTLVNVHREWKALS